MACCEDDAKVFIDVVSITDNQINELRSLLSDVNGYNKIQVMSIIGGINTVRKLPEFIMPKNSSFRNSCVYSGDKLTAESLFSELNKSKIISSIKYKR